MNNRTRELEQKRKSLEFQYADKKEVYDAMQDLKKKKVNLNDIILWEDSFNTCNLTPNEFHQKLKSYGDLKSLLRSMENEQSELDDGIRSKKQELTKIQGEIDEAKKIKSKLEGEIEYWKTFAIQLINSVKDNGIKELDDYKAKTESIAREGIGHLGLVTEDLKSKLATLKDATDKQIEAALEVGRLSGLKPIMDLLSRRKVDGEELNKELLIILKEYKNLPNIGYIGNSVSRVISELEM